MGRLVSRWEELSERGTSKWGKRRDRVVIVTGLFGSQGGYLGEGGGTEGDYRPGGCPWQKVVQGDEGKICGEMGEEC